MSHSYSDQQTINRSSTESFEEILEIRLSRRDWIKTALACSVLSTFPLAGCVTTGRGAGTMGFTGIAASTEDTVRLPSGYSYYVLNAWGDPIGHVNGAPAFKQDATNTAGDQLLQSGMHHDGIHYYPLPYGSDSSTHALIAVNHEYTDDGLLHSNGFAGWSAEKVRKSQNATGVSVMEIAQADGKWAIVQGSKYARRVTGNTPIRIAGPAAGSQRMKTAANPSGLEVLGTVNNCAHGYTPWGNYLTCEENWDGYFVNSGTVTADHRRNGIAPKGRGYRWHEFDERFDAGKHPNEPNRFGWVVELDPYDPTSTPVKRTALGRFSHEGAWPVTTADGRLAIYMGDDRTFEYVYKFVSRDRINTSDRAANRNLLDQGTLYVAKFHEDGSGEWVALVHGHGKLKAENGFADQADVLIKTRLAADAVGATRMDRPEWIAIHPRTKEIYCTLTNNANRGTSQTPGLNAANPRPNNVFGHIIRWREAENDPAALKFRWDMFLQAGDPQHPEEEKRGNIRGAVFGSPDGLWFDDSGLMWIQTDVSTSTLNKGHYERIGNNQMLCADIRSREVRRFLTGPRGCEVTGVIMTPDARTMFVNIQHPGESPSERSNPNSPKAVSTWPDGAVGGRPRSASIVIRKDDGGVIGT